MNKLQFLAELSLGPINYKVENYRVNFNDCLHGQVDMEEDYRSRGWEFKLVSTNINKDTGKW